MGGFQLPAVLNLGPFGEVLVVSFNKRVPGRSFWVPLSEKLFFLNKAALYERPKDLPKINKTSNIQRAFHIRKVKRENRELDHQHSHRNINSHQLNIDLQKQKIPYFQQRHSQAAQEVSCLECLVSRVTA